MWKIVHSPLSSALVVLPTAGVDRLEAVLHVSQYRLDVLGVGDLVVLDVLLDRDARCEAVEEVREVQRRSGKAPLAAAYLRVSVQVGAIFPIDLCSVVSCHFLLLRC